MLFQLSVCNKRRQTEGGYFCGPFSKIETIRHNCGGVVGAGESLQQALEKYGVGQVNFCDIFKAVVDNKNAKKPIRTTIMTSSNGDFNSSQQPLNIHSIKQEPNVNSPSNQMH